MKSAYETIQKILTLAVQDGRLEEAVKVLDEYAAQKLAPIFEATGCRTVEGAVAWIKNREKQTAY